MKQLTTFSIALIFPLTFSIWGFFGHKMINRHAIYLLPSEMISFYKGNMNYIIAQSVAPDKRRYAVEGEAPRHYIDLDMYGDSSIYKLPKYWKDAVIKYSEDTLLAHGIVPWHISLMQYKLTQAFIDNNHDLILKYSAEIGHYIGDANVPLHTTRNYNGQLTNQHGIHGLWESRLPELFSHDFDLWIGKADYVENTNKVIWQAIHQANQAVDSVFFFDQHVKDNLSEDLWYSFEQRGAGNVSVYSLEYSEMYHKLLDNMVERQMKRAIKMVADFWFTAWVDAGQPDMEDLDAYVIPADSLFVQKSMLMKSGRDHEH